MTLVHFGPKSIFGYLYIVRKQKIYNGDDVNKNIFGGIFVVSLLLILIFFVMPAFGIEIHNPFKKNVHFKVTVKENCFLNICTGANLNVQTIQSYSLFPVPAKPFAWVCVPLMVPDLDVELTIPSVGYVSRKTIKACEGTSVVDFIVGFDNPGTYSYDVKVYQGTMVVGSTSGMVTVR